MKIFKLPDLGEGLQEAEIVEWQSKAAMISRADKPLCRSKRRKRSSIFRRRNPAASRSCLASRATSCIWAHRSSHSKERATKPMLVPWSAILRSAILSCWDASAAPGAGMGTGVG